VVVASLLPTRTDAQDVDRAIADLLTVRSALIDAAVDAQFLRFEEAGASVASAGAVVAGLRANVSTVAVGTDAKKLGGVLKKLARKTANARRKLARPGKLAPQLAALNAAARLVSAAIAQLGHPVADEVGTPSGGFYGPGVPATFRIVNVDGSSCAEEADVTLSNDGFAHAVEPGSLSVDATTGDVSFVTGTETGTGRLVVRACGRDATIRVFNSGASAPTGTPNGFPNNLSQGVYDLYVTICRAGQGCDSESYVGALDYVTAQAFASDIDSYVIVRTSPGVTCTRSWRFTPFDGVTFAANLTLKCSLQGASATFNVKIRLELDEPTGCPTGTRLAQSIALPIAPGELTGGGAQTAIAVQPEDFVWDGVQIEEDLRRLPLPFVLDECPDTPNFCVDSNATFTVGNALINDRQVVVQPGRTNRFWDVHEAPSTTVSLLDVLGIDRCRARCLQTYFCNEGGIRRAIGTFTLDYSVTRSVSNGTPVSVISVQKR
jgi:hypothetical protein